MGHEDDKTMDGDASDVYNSEISSVEWQCGSSKTAHDVYGLIISRVEVDDSPRLMGQAHSPQTVGRPGMARPAGSCTTHEESFISRLDQKKEMSFIKGVGNGDAIPQPMVIQLNYR